MDISQLNHGGLVKKPDLRDYRLEVIPCAVQLPPTFSLRNKTEEIKNQGASCSCVAQATAYYVQLLNFLETGNQVEMSARDIYSLVAQPGGGAYVKDAFQKICDNGVVPENLASSYMNGQPPTEAYMLNRSDINSDLGTAYTAKSYVTWDNKNIDLYKQAIVQGNGMVAVTWGNNACFQGSPELLPDIPSQMVWRHGIYFTGYDDTKKLLEFVNSWSGNWGDAGFGYLPYAYIEKGYVSNPMTLIDLPNSTYSNLQKMMGILHNLISLWKQLNALKNGK